VVQSRAAAARKVFGKMPSVMEYLTRELSSKVCDIAIKSSLQLATKLSDRLGVNLWLKHEGQVLDKILFFHLANCPILLRLCLKVQNATGVPCAEL
jgi:threonine dehydratase